MLVYWVIEATWRREQSEQIIFLARCVYTSIISNSMRLPKKRLKLLQRCLITQAQQHKTVDEEEDERRKAVES